MCSINHDLKCIYFHIPKTGGLYIEKILEKCYNFQTYYFTADNHLDYLEKSNFEKEYIFKEFKGFLNIRTKGMYRYYINSKNFNYISDMNDEKWKSYKKFTFTRNPYDRCVSAYKYLKLYEKNIPLEDCLSNVSILNDYEFVHLIISQYNHIINNNDFIEFDYIGKFENLNEELINILLKLGINELKHLYYIENNIMINSNNDDKNFLKKDDKNFLKDNCLNNNTINLINNLFENDFKYFNYDKYDSFENYSVHNKKINIQEQNKNIISKYNFIKPVTYLNITNNNYQKINNNRPSKNDIHNDIKRNIFTPFNLSFGNLHNMKSPTAITPI